MNRAHTGRMGYEYTFLSDDDASVIRRYDLLHKGAGQNRADVARPAEFLLDRNGVVLWRNLTEDFRVRARPEEILKAIQERLAVNR